MHHDDGIMASRTTVSLLTALSLIISLTQPVSRPAEVVHAHRIYHDPTIMHDSHGFRRAEEKKNLHSFMMMIPDPIGTMTKILISIRLSFCDFFQWILPFTFTEVAVFFL